jgi:lipid II:glycine glycyltransferase (peptidoglycan interpeptide bridge formation enzyme)
MRNSLSSKNDSLDDLLAGELLKGKPCFTLGENLDISVVRSENRDRWNQLALNSPRFNLMQSFEWGELKRALGWKVVRIAVCYEDEYIAGTQILFYPIIRGLFSIAYIPRGPLAQPKDFTILESLFAVTNKIAKQERAIFLKIEPDWEYSVSNSQILNKYGFQLSQHTNQPRASLILDISSDPDTILARMSKSTRRNIRIAHRRGVHMREGNRKDLKIFYELLQLTAARSKFPIRKFDYYEKEWDIFSEKGQVCLLLAEYQKQVIATRMVFTFGSQAAQFHSASSGEYGNVKANHLLVWEAILWAKSLGCLSYDLWGIPDEVGELHYRGEDIPTIKEGGLWGVYQFKKGFGGNVVYYVGAYDYVYSNIIYALSINGFFRKFSIEQVITKLFH